MMGMRQACLSRSPWASTAAVLGRTISVVIELQLISDLRTVAKALEIDVARAADLPAFVLNPPDARKCHPRPAKHIKAEQVDAMLAPYRVDAVNGVPDKLIAARAKVSPMIMRAWRRRQKIEPPPGRRPYTMLLPYELQTMLGGAAARGPHPTSSSLDAFEPPAYVLREPLDYACFVRVVATLRASGFSIQQIASGVGVLDRDVAQAVQVGERRGIR